MKFELIAPYGPAGDQPAAITHLVKGSHDSQSKQVLLGVTGSGKTFTVANVIAQTQRPTLVISHNKTLAAQLYQEFRDFFPKNAVSYFVSYYDYYQPEAYLPQTDTYIEKETDINQNIDKLRLAATANLLARQDVIVVASVSCIYNLGSPITYQQATLELRAGMVVAPVTIMTRLQQLQYSRSDMDFRRGTYRVRGEIVDLYPAYQDYGYRMEWQSDVLISITPIDPITGIRPDPQKIESAGPLELAPSYSHVTIYPARHYIASEENREPIFEQIRHDLGAQLQHFESIGKTLEAYRLKQRINYDLEMLAETGFVNGIENYSRYFDGRNPGDAPFSLIDFFNYSFKDWLCVIDESHITIPQIRGMYNGDAARKTTLIDFGFRLPASLDNRPLKFDEFVGRLSHTLFTSATPAPWEIEFSNQAIVEQLIRPTGLLDPIIHIRPTHGQIQDLLQECQKRIDQGQRVLILTLTKRMAEDLAKFLEEEKIKVQYLHSEIETLERTNILHDLRAGEYDVLVGVNLLREGIDLPEVSLVAILDADKEGFLRSTTSLMQIMGRAARHHTGEVIMYADRTTPSMKNAIEEVDRRRKLQDDYNKAHGITPQTISKPLRANLIQSDKSEEQNVYVNSKKSKKNQPSHDVTSLLFTDTDSLTPQEFTQHVASLKRAMNQASKDLNFELAAQLRDKIRVLA